jgi:hypothetical protein
MQRKERFVEQTIQIEHVRAAPRKQRLEDASRRVGRLDLPGCEVDEERPALRWVLRSLRQLADETHDTLANPHV